MTASTVEDFSNFINTNRRDNWRIVRCRRHQHTSHTIAKGRHDLHHRNGPHPLCSMHEIAQYWRNYVSCLLWQRRNENSVKNYGLDLFARTRVEKRIEEAVDDSNQNVIQRYAESDTAGDLWMNEWSLVVLQHTVCVCVLTHSSVVYHLPPAKQFFLRQQKKKILTWSVCMALV